MLKRLMLSAALVLAAAAPAFAQAPDRDATREKVRALLAAEQGRSDISVNFRQSTVNEYNFIGSMTTGLTNSESLEIVISVTKNSTIGFRVYPHYNNGYINVDRARDPSGLMKSLLNLTDQNFLFWGIDDSHDTFSGYTITLESGFPYDAMVIVLRSIRNTDKYVGPMRQYIDGSAAADR
jgi:hypothetical protein